MREDFAAGDRLGRYELVSRIGGGGFASVWRARSVGLGGFQRDVAIKVIRQGRASLKRFQDMLLDEARLVARIQHPNVAQIWEVGEDPRSLYFVMELVEGDSLDELAMRADEAGKKLPIRAVMRVLGDACAGLHAAHELEQDGKPLGLVHRDVSPQNILVSRAGIAKLIDFGIAKAKERLAPDTTTGYIKGKISFMAPEQARSEEVDRRADIWAMGAVAYELVEGRPPFDAGNDLGRLASLVGPEPVAPMSDRTPLALRRVVEKCLQKDASERYESAAELKVAIDEALIEAELETSADEAASLLGPYFHGSDRPQTSPDADRPDERARPADAHSVERAVSSTIVARPKTDTIEIPRRPNRWPWIGLGLAAVPLVTWLAIRSDAPTSTDGAELRSSAAEVVSTAPANETSSVGATATSKDEAPEPVTSTSSSASTPVLAPSLQTSAVQPPTAKPAVPAVRPTAKPTAKPRVPKPHIDPDAIE